MHILSMGDISGAICGIVILNAHAFQLFLFIQSFITSDWSSHRCYMTDPMYMGTGMLVNFASGLWKVCNSSIDKNVGTILGLPLKPNCISWSEDMSAELQAVVSLQVRYWPYNNRDNLI